MHHANITKSKNYENESLFFWWRGAQTSMPSVRQTRAVCTAINEKRTRGLHAASPTTPSAPKTVCTTAGKQTGETPASIAAAPLACSGTLAEAVLTKLKDQNLPKAIRALWHVEQSSAKAADIIRQCLRGSLMLGPPKRCAGLTSCPSPKRLAARLVGCPSVEAINKRLIPVIKHLAVDSLELLRSFAPLGVNAVVAARRPHSCSR